MSFLSERKKILLRKLPLMLLSSLMIVYMIFAILKAEVWSMNFIYSVSYTCLGFMLYSDFDLV